MPFTFTKLSLPEVILIQPKVFKDDRGFFVESYKRSDFMSNGIDVDFYQDNHSFSKKGVLRGLHFQLEPRPQGKLVRVVKGAVWDVAVDVRRSSPTFKRWVGEELSESNHRMLYIPPGFAHGFVAFTDDVHLMYKCTSEWDASLDKGIIWNDPDLAVDWPVKSPLLSGKDEGLPLLKDAEIYD